MTILKNIRNLKNNFDQLKKNDDDLKTFSHHFEKKPLQNYEKNLTELLKKKKTGNYFVENLMKFLEFIPNII